MFKAAQLTYLSLYLTQLSVIITNYPLETKLVNFALLNYRIDIGHDIFFDSLDPSIIFMQLQSKCLQLLQRRIKMDFQC